MIYGSLQAQFMEAKHNGHIHRYGTPIFGNIVVYLSKPIDNVWQFKYVSMLIISWAIVKWTSNTLWWK